MTAVPKHLQLGIEAEKKAFSYLKRQGFTLISRNYHSPYGELDLIVENDETLVFVEVRYRKNSHYGSPQDTVDFRKQKKLRATAEYFLQRAPKASQKACRFDIVTFTGHLDSNHINWIKNAFY